ncbi:septal ring lytic transglycosylase RlpA family protein [Caulobacter sp. NIBR1757]|uniref:septal ring lytic transglycosylase RlpA family protein n=1 Tax=Caulobacter sp. NIBR1757 TaxID=3016000 RepID=UPI0022F055E6|nr:septal ring lytic transglycosylase RlpA family protein [Caulobacter sp. NIBR1757]WGM39358.1 Endolytic peptidoglycan transglycosylase RlpA [Caulobacter sp. NIBR1757]
MGREVLTRGGAIALALLASASLAACATPRLSPRMADSKPAPSKPGGRVPGTMRPYQVGGIWYTPREQPGYNEVGIASWYGQQFHNRQTANGENFDMWVVSAAHKTLPLPCIVEVTNLDNGKKIKVRVNDRGPFVGGRIIDMSRAGADALGFAGKGTARVRVRYVGPAPPRGKDRTLQYAGLDKDEAPRALVPRSGDDWVIQAGAFADRDNAEKAVNSLRDVGRARIVPLKRDGRTLYRVVIESGRDVQGAGRLRDQVAQLGFPDAKLIADR